MTRPAEAAEKTDLVPRAFVEGGGRWLPPGVPPAVRFIERLGISPGRLLVCVLIAIAIHIPLLPFARLFAFGWFDETEETDAEAVVPIELIVDESEDTIETPPPEQPPVEPPVPGPGDTIVDAGVDASKNADDAALDAGPDAGLDAGPDADVADAGPDAGPDAAPPPKEPVANNKAIKDLSKNPNNVQIVLVGSRLREHPVGAKLGGLLPTLKQWEPFFKDSGINPVDDIDAMIITGPQVRVSGEVIAIMKFNIDMERVESTIQGLADRSGGSKLEGTPVPAWKATADRGARLFAVVPDKGLLYVLPWPKQGKKEKQLEKEEWEKEERRRVDQQLSRVKAAKFPDYTKEPYAIDAYMIEPYKIVSKTGEAELGPFKIQLIPQTLQSMRILVKPNGGDADVTLTFNAKDKDEAASAIRDLEASWPLFQVGAKSEVGMELPDLTWEQKGATIEAKATLPQSSLEKVFELGQKHAEEVKKKREK